LTHIIARKNFISTGATIAGGLIAICAISLLSASPRPASLSEPGKPPASDSAFTPDKGKFKILLNGAEAGSEDFELSPAGNGWLARGSATIHAAGGSESHSSGQLRLTPDGTPIHYEWTATGEKKTSGTVDFENGTAKTSTELGSKDPLKRDFKFTSSHIAVLDNNLYDQYAILARLYDWNAKGAQTFPVLIPQDVTPGSISVEFVGEKEAGSQLQQLNVRSTDLEVEIYFDSKHHLMRLEVPDAKVVIVRQ